MDWLSFRRNGNTFFLLGKHLEYKFSLNKEGFLLQYNLHGLFASYSLGFIELCRVMYT